MKKLLFSILAGAGMMSCAGGQSKTLVLYYSQEGSTETVAKEIASQTGWDIARIEVTPAYDGDFNQTVQRAQRENQSGQLPELVPLKVNLADYDRIFLGFPIWSGIYANPIKSLLEEADFDGKTIVTFCTFGSGGLATGTKALKDALPGATVIEGYGCRAARMDAVPAEVNRFLISGGYKEGTVAPQPDFPESKPVSESDVETFNAACSSYQFPLGTPVEVASREIEGATEYKYTVASSGFGGGSSRSTIFVIAQPGKTPEFTEVVR